MPHRFLLRAALMVCLAPLAEAGEKAISPRTCTADTQALDAWVDGHLDDLLQMCRHIHQHPELSGQEERTGALVAERLQKAGCRTLTGIGGHGVVGILENGAGPVVLVRGDMDALPIIEDTGLPFASAVRVKKADGTEVGVMHACGHDIHTSVLVGTAEALAALRAHWRGTAVFIGQPAEEAGNGAFRMIQDGLFDRIPRPAFCIALHVAADMPAGQIGYTPGWAAANVDSVDITIHGRGGHGARPNAAVDPVVVGAYLITQLQTLVSRRIDPIAPAVVTVGSIHAGSKHNVIPDELRMQLTVRSYTDEVRQQLLEGIDQLARQTCAGFNCPKPPDVVVDPEYTPACYNDPGLTRAAAEVFSSLFGADNVREQPPEMGGEDFGFFARTLKVPGLQFDLGTVETGQYEASLAPGASKLPSLHSSRYAPDYSASLRSGVRAMTSLALALFDAPS